MRTNQEGEIWAVTVRQLLFRLMKMFLDVFMETPKPEASGRASPLRRWSDIWGKSSLILAHFLPDTQLRSVSCKGCTVTRCFSSFSTSSHDGISALILATGSGDHKQKAPDQSQIGMTISMWELLEDGGSRGKLMAAGYISGGLADGSESQELQPVRADTPLLCCPSLLSGPRLIVHLFTWSGPIKAHSFSLNIYTQAVLYLSPRHPCWTSTQVAFPAFTAKIIRCFLCMLIHPLTCVLFFYFPILLLQISAENNSDGSHRLFPVSHLLYVVL